MNNLFAPQLTRQVIIGTKSNSRRGLFNSLKLKFKYRSANIDERKVSNLKNDKYDALKIATAKARHLSSKYKNKIVVTFDTIIIFKKKTVYKCTCKECCKKLLKSFSNKQHILYTGMVFMVNNKIIQQKLTRTIIHFKNNNSRLTNNYVEKYFSQIKYAVGCYNIEGPGIDFFQNIDKSFFNVLGIDIINFLKLLRKI